MNNTVKAILCILLVIAGTVGVVWALSTWTGTVNVNIGVDTGYHVTDAGGTATLSPPYTVDVTTVGNHTFTYRLYNDGNVDITITITETDNLPANCTAQWDITWPLIVTEETYATVTLTIEAKDPGTGSYTWTWDSAEA